MIRTPEVHIHRLSEHTFDGMTEAPYAKVLGRRAIYRAFGGGELIGTIEAPTPVSSGYPIIRFADGTWGRCDDEIRVLS